MSINTQETNQPVILLQKLDEGDLPLPIFELVPLRATGGAIEVLLLKRNESDPVWGGQLHTPGTVVRTADASEGAESVLQRLIDTELAGVKLFGSPTYVETLVYKNKRGVECSTIFYKQIKSDTETTVGDWYNVTDLPDNLVDSQREFIYRAAQQFNDDAQIGEDI